MRLFTTIKLADVILYDCSERRALDILTQLVEYQIEALEALVRFQEMSQMFCSLVVYYRILSDKVSSPVGTTTHSKGICMKNQYDNHNCLESGDEAENIFKLTSQKNGYLTSPSTREENINSHIDIWLTKNNTTFGVDVKAAKRISRNKSLPTQDNLLWIELHSVRPNNKGWLYSGHAKFIAFEQQNTFIIIKREKLIELIPIHTKKIFVSQAHQAQGKLYQRPNRCDILTLIDTNIIIPYSTIWTKPL